MYNCKYDLPVISVCMCVFQCNSYQIHTVGFVDVYRFDDTYVSGHEGGAVLLPGFAIKW